MNLSANESLCPVSIGAAFDTTGRPMDFFSNDSNCPLSLGRANGTTGPKAVLEKYETSLLMLLGFGGVSVILALLHNVVRKYIFHDDNNLDTTFDAGGNVTTSLTAVTVASQLFWPADILQSATITAKIGIAGPFWYAVSVVVNIFIFPMLSVTFKTRAPGAKTYLQVIRARFGKKAHVTYCCFALLTNIVIMTALLLAGKATIQSLTRDASDEFVLLVMATLFGSYSLIGGIGTTFYVSYFNACLIFVFLVIFFAQILHNTDNEFDYLGDVSKLYHVISCVEGPPENTQNSFLTFQSGVAVLYGVVGFFVASAVTYCDQASWQSRIAAKPKQGVLGFILAGCMWFAIPSTMAATTGMTYIALCADSGSHILNDAQLDEGFVTPLIAQKTLGQAGGTMVLTILSMALMSTGSGEVMAVSSILVYDIYQTYIRPYRKCLSMAHCIMCGKTNKQNKTYSDDQQESFCQCVSVANCQHCHEDIGRLSRKLEYGIHMPYECTVHGQYRLYQDYLIQFKNWCIVFVSMSIIPFGLIVFKIGIDLNWIFYVGAIVTIPCFPPVILSIVWVRTTSAGMITGGVAGLLLGIAATLITATTYEQGLGNFLVNTSKEYSILAGTCISFGASLIGCIVASIFTNRIKTCADADFEWQKLYDIDNPLNPWELNYREELKGLNYDTKPTFEQMSSAFLRAKRIAFIGGTCSIVMVVAIIPGIMASIPVLTENQFKIWMSFTQAWAVLMGGIAIIAPPTEEIVKIVKRYNKNKEQRKVSKPQESTLL